MRRLSVVALGLIIVFSAFSRADIKVDVNVQGLFKNAAVLNINGKQRMLKVGKSSPEGVLLVAANAKTATIEINGKRQVLTLSRRIFSKYKTAEKTEISILRNQNNQYKTSALINGQRTMVLVDTGANTVAMSGVHAKALGLDYRKGERGRVRTASGEAEAYNVSLRTIGIGGITVNGVRATVIEGSYPTTILLGMTFLNHVDMREKDGILYLQSKF